MFEVAKPIFWLSQKLANTFFEGPLQISQRTLNDHGDWSRKIGKVDFGAYPTQEAGFPRKLALWTSKDGFSYMNV